MRRADSVVSAMSSIRDKLRKVGGTYRLLKKLSSINGSIVSRMFLSRVMFSCESLPPLGKEYWWFLFFGNDGRQIMVLVYRKYGKKMTFNEKKDVVLRKETEGIFQAVVTAWIYDGKEIYDLGVSNPDIVISQKEKRLVSQIANRKLLFKGNYPRYSLTIDDLVRLDMTEGSFIENCCAWGVYLPPFGAGWIDIFSNAKGVVLGEKFEGTAHLQKVVGIMPYGSFHWARVVFRNGSVFSFFSLKTSKKSKMLFHSSMNFSDHRKRTYIRFKNPGIMISKMEETTTWTIRGQDEENELKIVLETYAEKKFTMHGGGSQVYIEYAVHPAGFTFKTKDTITTLDDLGTGVGTFEDAYGSALF